MIHTVFLDLDDTLNSFTLHVLRRTFGIDVSDFDYDRFPHQVGYEIREAYHLMKPDYYPSFELAQFWDAVKREVWATLPKSLEFNQIIQSAQALAPQDRIYILTGPTKDPDCLAGKLEWIHRVMPPWLHRQYFIGPRKQVIAKPEYLLIDDSDAQVNAWREAGGQAILVPRPWNSLHGLDTSSYLRQEFALL